METVNVCFVFASALLITVVANESSVPLNDLHYRLLTRNNPEQYQNIIHGDINSARHSNLNLAKNVYILVHGLGGNAEDGFNEKVRKAILRMEDANIISVDWSRYASGVEYEEAIQNMPAAADGIASFLDWMIQTVGVPIKKLKYIGFSLGGQMGGYVGRRLKNGKFPYIMALDPAGKYFEGTENSITKNDGEYVELIHTTATIGLAYPTGHNDFYPNKGVDMPGCDDNWGCSHVRAVLYFAESIDNHKFMGRQCTDYEKMLNGICANISELYMGGLQTKKAVGIFYLETNKFAPFAKNIE